MQYGLYNSKVGLTLVYVAIQLPLTIYILESFFARIPSDLFDAARMDGYSDWEIFWRVSFPIALPAVATTVILNFILLWNEFLYAVVLITEEANRTLPLGIQRFIGDSAGGRRHDRHRADDRHHSGGGGLRLLLRAADPGHDRRRGEVRDARAMAVVTLDRLTKIYDRAHAPAADAVSLEVRHGEFMVLLGPSGCGKTTTLRMIAGLESISSGTLSIDGRDGQARCRPRTATSPWCSSPTRSTRT